MLQSIKRRLLSGRRRRERPIVTGDLELFGLSEIIQFLGMGKKTALVALSRGHHQGRIWFLEGRATHATTDTAEGEAAFFETVCWNTGSFVIDYGITSDRQTLHDDTMYLFMEGLRRIDESRGALEHGPEFESGDLPTDEAIAAAIVPVDSCVLEEEAPAPGYALEHAAEQCDEYASEAAERFTEDCETPVVEADESGYAESFESHADEAYPADTVAPIDPATEDPTTLTDEMHVELAEAMVDGGLQELPLEAVEVSSEMHEELIETIVEEHVAAPPVAVPENYPVRLSREMSSELDETMAEVDQLMDLDAQGFVVVDPDAVPARAQPPAPPQPRQHPESGDAALPSEVLALHQALDDD